MGLLHDAGLAEAIRRFFSDLERAYDRLGDESWGDAMNEMSEETNRRFVLALARLQEALNQ